MIILGIETSCDETAAAVVKDGCRVLSNVVASSQNIHVKTGGIIPENAARKQIEYIIPVVQKALIDYSKFTNIQFSSIDELSNEQMKKWISENIDAIAVTYGPGLIGSLLVGVETAKTLSYLWEKPLVPVNHLVAHIYANWLRSTDPFSVDRQQFDKQKSENEKPEFPTLALVVSGGHTDLVLMKDHNNIKWIGGTRDDAAGEAFDKTARLLGLPYPGGPSISKAAGKFIKGKWKFKNEKLDLFPRPMITSDNFDWSFSGLKTAVLNESKKTNDDVFKKEINRYAAEIEQAIVDVLVKKTLKAIEKYKPKSFALAGGVAANKKLRETFFSVFSSKMMKIEFHVPALGYCTDNAAMIASCAFFNNQPIQWTKVAANPQLEIVNY